VGAETTLAALHSDCSSHKGVLIARNPHGTGMNDSLQLVNFISQLFTK